MLGDEMDPQELKLATAGEWARDTLKSYKVLEERARSQNIWELITPEALETVSKFLWDASEFELEVEYPAEDVATEGVQGRDAQGTSTECGAEQWCGGMALAS